MPTRDEAMTLAHHLHALAGGAEVTRKAAARQIARLEPTDATELIHHLLMLARQGWEPANCVLGAMVSALEMEAAQIPYASELKRLASLQDFESVAALFPEGPPKQQMHPEAAARADARLLSNTLGFTKTRARTTTNPDELSRLAAVSDPTVMRNVLLNPRLTEEHVVRIAARRPARPEPLIEIWRSARWSVRHQVRRALVFNPYLPPEVGSKIVPLLNQQDLLELSEDRGVHPSLRQQAKLLLEAGPQRR